MSQRLMNFPKMTFKHTPNIYIHMPPYTICLRCINEPTTRKRSPEYQSPVLHCPPDIVVEMPPHESRTHVRLPTGRTDVKWTRDVRSQPPWAKRTAIQLPVGSVNVTLTAVHPLAPELSVNCAYAINVLGMYICTTDVCVGVGLHWVCCVAAATIWLAKSVVLELRHGHKDIQSGSNR